jgi:hypothetical protein
LRGKGTWRHPRRQPSPAKYPAVLDRSFAGGYATAQQRRHNKRGATNRKERAMSRDLKLGGLAFAAVLAAAVFMASSASATGFKCNEAPCVLTGTTENTTVEERHAEFTASGVTIKCHDEFEGTQAEKTAETLTVTPHYTACTGSPAPTVTTNHCAYVFGATTNAEEHATVELECATPEERIETHIPNVCTLDFKAQKFGGGVHYTNLGNGEVTLKTTMKEAVFTKTAPPEGSNFCGLISGKMKTEGVLLLQCYKDEGSALIGTEKTTPTSTATQHSVGTVPCEWEKV